MYFLFSSGTVGTFFFLLLSMIGPCLSRKFRKTSNATNKSRMLLPFLSMHAGMKLFYGCFFRCLSIPCPSQFFLARGQVRAGHLRDASSFGCVSFVVGCFPGLFLYVCSGLMASGVGMAECFLTLTGKCS